MIPKPRFVVDLQVTGKCNLTCDFCAGAPKEYAGAELRDILNGIDKLVEAGLTTLNISGGEPLVRKDTRQILSHARSKGIEVYLSTNGLLLERFYDQVIPHITTLGLPVDGSTPEMNMTMTRGPKQFNTALHFLRRFKREPPSFSVKVGTVVSAINLHDVPNIGCVLFEDDTIYAPDVWRLYEFTPLGDGRFSKDRHSLPTASFDNVVRQVKSAFPARLIVPLSNKDSNGSYIFIDPRLFIQIYINDNYLVVGDLKEMPVKDLLALKSRYLSIVAKGGQNREWISLRGEKNVD